MRSAQSENKLTLHHDELGRVTDEYCDYEIRYRPEFREWQTTWMQWIYFIKHFIDRRVFFLPSLPTFNNYLIPHLTDRWTRWTPNLDLSFGILRAVRIWTSSSVSFCENFCDTTACLVDRFRICCQGYRAASVINSTRNGIRDGNFDELTATDMTSGALRAWVPVGALHHSATHAIYRVLDRSEYILWRSEVIPFLSSSFKRRKKKTTLQSNAISPISTDGSSSGRTEIIYRHK